jgi:uncharacterized protein (DUF2384 family)
MAIPALLTDLGLDARKTPDLADTPTRRKLSSAAITAFFSIVEKWSLKNEDAMALLGGVSNGRYYDLKKHRTGLLTQDELTRVSLLIGIFKSLNILFGEKLADAWISRPNSNPMFGGEPPLKTLIQGGVPGILSVRRLLDSRRGGR